MKLKQITDWLDGTLDVASFSDVSNNGVQIDREGEKVTKVAFAVDASVAAVEAAAVECAPPLSPFWGDETPEVWAWLRRHTAEYNALRANYDIRIAHNHIEEA